MLITSMTSFTEYLIIVEIQQARIKLDSNKNDFTDILLVRFPQKVVSVFLTHHTTIYRLHSRL